ncbi:ArsB/NhaD family transporter [Peribacillus tepidiphilus]|uniref:ArsB/NhaD family transporter n=1 Tax=Peribacillus tepidiphilus TaxID=2652445 RepID=UPI0012925822|nr:ArsB/NhaD family transporter [Peribacillus tepidiphilus]
MDQQSFIAIGIFLLTYGLIIAEKVHRTIIAMTGSLIMITVGIMTQESALHHIDFNTIGLLIGMMIIVSITGQTGVFNYIAVKATQFAKANPIRVLIMLGLVTAFGSAFLDNVTTVLLMVPVTFKITQQLKVNPIPYLITEIFASNIGGTSTMIGDPPNIMIGSAVKELTFNAFIDHLFLISFFILFVTVGILAFWYRKDLKTTDELKEMLLKKNAREEITDSKLLAKCLLALTVTIGGFFLHQFVHIETATISLIGAFLLLFLTGEKYLDHALEKVEWTTLFFFIGLFVIVGGLVETGVISTLAKKTIALTGGEIVPTTFLILWVSAIASAFIDNIPFVATMIPLIKEMGNSGIQNLEPLWWSLALGACLGGNGTLIGASANLVVAGLASKEGYHISFKRFLVIGFPVMLLSIIISSIYIWFRYLS